MTCYIVDWKPEFLDCVLNVRLIPRYLIFFIAIVNCVFSTIMYANVVSFYT